MKRICAVVGALAMALALAQPALAADTCPPEVAQAKAMLQKAAAAQKTRTAKSQEVQAPRSLAASKGQEVQAPRGQEVQAPRGQEVQAPRGQEVQAPRSQEVQAPRSQEVQAPRSLTNVRRLVSEAEMACKKGNMELASKKANEAMNLLK